MDEFLEFMGFIFGMLLIIWIIVATVSLSLSTSDERIIQGEYIKLNSKVYQCKPVLVDPMERKMNNE